MPKRGKVKDLDRSSKRLIPKNQSFDELIPNNCPKQLFGMEQKYKKAT